MTDQQKTREQLIEELDVLRQQVAALQEKRKRASEANDHIGPGDTMWQSLVAETPVFILILDQDCRIRFANHTDSGAMPDQIVGKLLYDFCRPEARDSVRECVQRVFQTATPDYYEDSSLRLDEQEHWYASCFGPILENGKVVAVSVVSSNVTDRKQTERALQRSEERFRKVFEEGPLGVVLLGLDAHIQHCNHRFCEMLGYSEEEIIALGLVGITHADDWEGGQQLVSQLLHGEIPNYTIEKRYLRKGGTVFWGQLTASMMHDAEGKPTTVIGMIEDITERKRAEEGLRNSERTLRTLIDASPESIMLIDTDETILCANATMAQRFGTTTDKIVGRTSYDLVSPELAAKRMEHLQEVVRTGKAIRFEDQRSERYFEIAMHPILDEKEKVASVAVLAIDRTDRKRAEEALKQAHDELEDKVRERTSELFTANEQLKREVEERRQAKEALQQSHEELKVIYDGMVDGLIVTDVETQRFMRVNASICRMLGYSETELLSLSVKDIHPAEALPHILERIRSIKEANQTPPKDMPFLRKDGSIFYAEIIGKFLIYAGRPCSMGIFRDITERKQAEEAIRQGRDELRAIYDGMVDGLLMADIETRHFVSANASLCRMLGYSEAELLSLSVKDIHPEADLPFVVEQFQALAEGRLSVSEEIPVLRKDGTVFYAVVSSSKTIHAGRRCVVGFFRDVTERRIAQEALRQSHDELETIYDDAVDGIIIVDAKKMNPLRANSAYCQMVGYSGEEVYSVSPERLHPPEVLPAVVDHLDAVQKGSVARIDDLPFLRKDGRIIYADVVSSPIYYNERPCWISFFHDVTERKHAQEAVERERQSLWRMLQASDHERQTISYEIHDGLAQYLAAANMQLQVFDGLRESNPKEAKKAFDAATQLVSQAHSESRRLISEVRHPVIDESGLETAISHLVHEQRRHGGPTIKFDSEVQFKRLPSILENAIYRIAQEALTNACKHSKSKKVVVTMTQDGQDVRLEVWDWGIGFDQETIGKGHFGLEGIRQRVRLLDGRLTIESTPGSGTLVQVVVPILEKQTEG